MFKPFRFLFPAAVVILLLAGCAGVNRSSRLLTAERPKDEACRTELKQELSTVNVAIETTAAELAAALNRSLPMELYNGATGTGAVSAKIARRGPLSLSVADNYFHLSVPVSFGLSYGPFHTPSLSTTLKFKISLKVTPEWTIDSKVYYTGLTDSIAEELHIGPLSIRPRAILEGMTLPLQRTLSDAVTRKVNEKLALKSQVARAWQEAQKPILLDRNYHAWLVLTPREIVLHPLYAANNKVKVSAGLSSFAEVVLGPQPPARPTVPLPALKIDNRADKSFRVAVSTVVSYNDLLDIARPLLLNREFGHDGRSVIVRDLDLHGNGERLLLKVATSGSIDGVFYLTCRPVFDPRTNVISVQDLDFDIDSRNILLHTADWFLHSTFKDAIREKLNMDLTKRLAEARELAEKSIRRVKVADDLYFTATLTEMRLNDLLVQKDRMSVGLYLEGESSLLLDGAGNQATTAR